MPSNAPVSASHPNAGELPEGALEWLRESLPTPPCSWESLPGGAGARRYWRLHDSAGGSRIFMWALPENPAILPPALRVAADQIPFLEVASFLAEHGVPVPEIHAVDSSRRWIVLEDLGSRHVRDLRGAEREAAHEASIDLLAHVHSIVPDRSADPLPLPFRRAFDAEWMGFEVGLFLALDLPAALRAQLETQLAHLVRRLDALPRVLCLRDYQSHNLLIDPRGRLRVIDFQDAVLAAPGLDLASLLWDSYLPITSEERSRLLARYSERAPLAVSPAELAMSGLQRKCKDFSRFHILIHERSDLRYVDAHTQAALAIREAARDLPQELEELSRLVLEALRELGA